MVFSLYVVTRYHSYGDKICAALEQQRSPATAVLVFRVMIMFMSRSVDNIVQRDYLVPTSTFRNSSTNNSSKCQSSPVTQVSIMKRIVAAPVLRLVVLGRCVFIYFYSVQFFCFSLYGNKQAYLYVHFRPSAETRVNNLSVS